MHSYTFAFCACNTCSAVTNMHMQQEDHAVEDRKREEMKRKMKRCHTFENYEMSKRTCLLSINSSGLQKT